MYEFSSTEQVSKETSLKETSLGPETFSGCTASNYKCKTHIEKKKEIEYELQRNLKTEKHANSLVWLE